MRREKLLLNWLMAYFRTPCPGTLSADLELKCVRFSFLWAEERTFKKQNGHTQRTLEINLKSRKPLFTLVLSIFDACCCSSSPLFFCHKAVRTRPLCCFQHELIFTAGKRNYSAEKDYRSQNSMRRHGTTNWMSSPYYLHPFSLTFTTTTRCHDTGTHIWCNLELSWFSFFHLIRTSRSKLVPIKCILNWLDNSYKTEWEYPSTCFVCG